MAIAPFIAASQSKKLRGVVQREFGSPYPTALKTIPQILGKVPAEFVAVADILQSFGYTQVNWNLGCPYPMVVTKGKGAGLLAHPDRIESFLSQIMPLLGVKLSVKVRLGMLEPQEIFRLIPVFNRFPLEEIIIHPRTGKQQYQGTVDLDTLEQVLTMIRHPVVYSGDIYTLRDYQVLAQRFPTIHRWMLGRGVLRKPFLVEEIRSGSSTDFTRQRQRLFHFHQELYHQYCAILSGPAHLTDRMKSIWAYLAYSFEQPNELLQQVRHIHHPNEYETWIKRLFNV